MSLRTALAGATVLLLASSTARAQVPDESPPSLAAIETAASLSGPIVSVLIATPQRGEDPWARVGLSHGTPFSAARAREALRTALASGTFASATVLARPVDGGVELVIRGERRYRLVDLDVRGASARDPELVREDASLHGDMAVTEAEVDESLRRIEASYRDAGFPEAHARAVWDETDTPGARTLTLVVTEGPGLRVRAVEVLHVPAAYVDGAREAAVLRAGDLAGPVRLRVGEESLTTHLRRQGFLDARVETAVDALPGGGVRVRYEVTPGTRYAMAWVGALALPEESLLEALRLGEEHGFTEATLSSFAARVQDFYARRGWSDARVVAALDPGEGDVRTVRISVSEGAQVFVRGVRFPGATVLTQAELLAIVEGAARAELPSTPRPYRGRLFRERTFTAGVYATASQRIVDAYRERGYLDAAVAAPRTTRAETPDGPRLDVELRITEGPRSYVEELTFEGNRAMPSASLAAAWNLPLGVALSYREVSEARVRLGDWYRERGYAFARVEPEIDRSPDHTRARVRVVVHEGPRVRIGRIEVRGNSTARESVIRARLSLASGDFFSLSTLRASQRQLYELGVFTSVNVGLEDGDIEAPVKTLLVRVVEDRRYRLELRAGFSLGQGARTGVEFSYLDLGGYAMNLTVRPELGYLLALPVVAPTPPARSGVTDWDTARLTGRFPVSLAFPYIPALGPRFGASIDAVVGRALQPWSLSLTTLGLGGTLNWRPVQRLSLSFTTEVQRIDVGLFCGANSIEGCLVEECVEGVRSQARADFASGRRASAELSADEVSTANRQCAVTVRPQLQSYLRYAPGRSDLAAFRLGVVWDGRDNPLTPTRGLYLSVTSELLVLLGFDGEGGAARPSDLTAHFEGRMTGYVRLPVAGMVLALSARGGRNVSLAGNENTHPSRLFWLGGAGSMRGWIQNQLIPQDSLDEGNYTVGQGGEFYLNFVADLRIPTGWCPAAGACLEFGAFTDVGNVWRRPPAFADWWRLRISPGAGIRVTSPVGIIALDVGFVPFYYRDAGESWWQTVQFYLGNTL